MVLCLRRAVVLRLVTTCVASVGTGCNPANGFGQGLQIGGKGIEKRTK